MQPRYELNAADLYIPSMAFVTYILVVGYVLGLQDRFSPEILATTASSALTALLLEILVHITGAMCVIKIEYGHWRAQKFFRRGAWGGGGVILEGFGARRNVSIN